MENGKTIIEINGVKLEVDLRTARRIDELRVGSRVKVLIKQYGDSFTVYAGCIVGFDAFETLPTIRVAYIDPGYLGGLKFASYNAHSKDIEMVADTDNASLELDKGAVLDMIDRQIDSKAAEVDTLRKSRDYFLNRFGAYFADATVDA